MSSSQDLLDRVCSQFLGTDDVPSFDSLGLKPEDDHQFRLIADLRASIHNFTPPLWRERLRDVARWYGLRQPSREANIFSRAKPEPVVENLLVPEPVREAVQAAPEPEAPIEEESEPSHFEGTLRAGE